MADDNTTNADEMSADDAKSFFTQAQAKVTEAVHAAIEAAKENPKTAAAIATGAAAAVGAAAFGVTKLREGGSGASGNSSKGSSSADENRSTK